MPQPYQYADRDLAVLRFIRRSGNFSLAAPIASVFMAGKPCDHVLRQLSAKGFLKLFPRAVNGFTYALLTAPGFRAIGKEVETVKTPTPTTIDTAIAISWHCSLDGANRRYRMFSSEVDDRFSGAVPKNVPYVITDEFGGDPVVLRVHLATSKVATTKNFAEAFFHDNRTKAGIAAPIASRDFGLLCLCPTVEKVKQVKASLTKHKLFTKRRLVVALGPTSETYGDCLKKRGKK